MPRQYPTAFRQELVNRMLAGESVPSLVAEFGFPSRRCTGGSPKLGSRRV